LRELGYVDGTNVPIDYRFAEGNAERQRRFAEELVRLPVGVIVTVSTPANRAARQATQPIPIVMALSGDDAGAPGIASLARPVGNVTGLTASGWPC
jgi:putative ABC transport system substrate-binding protein